MKNLEKGIFNFRLDFCCPRNTIPLVHKVFTLKILPSPYALWMLLTPTTRIFCVLISLLIRDVPQANPLENGIYSSLPYTLGMFPTINIE